MKFPEFSSNPTDYINYGTWAEARINALEAKLKKQQADYEVVHSLNQMQAARIDELQALLKEVNP